VRLLDAVVFVPLAGAVLERIEPAAARVVSQLNESSVLPEGDGVAGGP
jgi:hypothetical protein